jgi:hypothetical protein
MRCSRIIRARRSKRPSAVRLRALVGGAQLGKPKKGPAQSRAVYPPEMDRMRRSLELSGMWTQVPGLCLVLHGQLPSGKNQVGIRQEEAEVPFETGKSRHHPYARFDRWRRDAEKQVLLQVGRWRASLPVSVPMLMYVWYWPGDRRTRDRSGMEDALFHLFEHAGIIANDGLIEDPMWRTMPLDKQDPRVVIVLRPYFPLQSPTLSYTPEFDRSACAHCWMPFDQNPLPIPA